MFPQSITRNIAGEAVEMNGSYDSLESAIWILRD